MPRAKDEDVRVLLVEANTGTFKITVPAAYKITFGRLQPSERFNAEEPALRIYENQTQQRAVFRGVKSFRDLSLPIERLVVNEQGEQAWEVTDTTFTSTKIIKKEKTWKAE